MKNIRRFAPLLLALIIAAYFGLGQQHIPQSELPAAGTPQTLRAAMPADYAAHSTLPQIQRQHLPREAQTTLRLIEQGGPFPYQRDGLTFQNRERRLPLKPGGYYREYTVPTPGARDRGARRIVSGTRHEYYYTADHYRSFQEVIP